MMVVVYNEREIIFKKIRKFDIFNEIKYKINNLMRDILKSEYIK